MRETICVGEGLYEALVEAARSLFDDDLCSVIVFGSSVYMGAGRDIDVLVVVARSLDTREKMSLELEVLKRLRSTCGMLPLDVHVLGLEDLGDNLRPGGFLSGLALGYRILYDKCNVKGKVIGFLRMVAGESYVLHNRYGSWDIGFYATILLRRLKRELDGVKTATSSCNG